MLIMTFRLVPVTRVSQNSENIFAHLHFPKAEIGECDSLLQSLYNPDDFSDGVPYPNEVELQMEDDDNPDSHPTDTNEGSEEDETDGGFRPDVHGPQIGIGTVVVLMLLAGVALLIWYFKRSREWVWADIKDRVWESTKDKIQPFIDFGARSAVTQLAALFPPAIQEQMNANMSGN